MEKNFTPVNVEVIKQKYNIKDASRKSFDINAVFLTLIVITLIVLAVLLFILIQKKMQELALGSFFA